MTTRVPPLSPQEWALCLTTMAWGFSFVVIRLGLTMCGPLFFVGLRFATATAFLFLMALPTLRAMTRRELLGGMAIGLSVFGGFALQTAGLVYIPVAKSAFITAFYVLLVPLLEWCLRRVRPGFFPMLGLAIAFPGVLLLSGGGPAGDGVGPGELLTLLCTVSYAVEVILMGVYAPGSNVLHLLLVELGVTSVLAFAFMPVLGEPVPAFSAELVALAAGLGAVTALVQGVVLWAQKTVPPTRAAVIYTSEPAWGGLAGWLAGERVGLSAVAGCALVIAGILVGILGGGRAASRDRAGRGG